MRQLAVKTAKFVLYTLLTFYILVALFVITVPSVQNFFTILSCISAIVTTGLCTLVTITQFNKKQFWYSLLRVVAVLGVCLSYIAYLKTEYSFLSTSFHFISISFDFTTSLLSFVATKGIVWNEQQ